MVLKHLIFSQNNFGEQENLPCCYNALSQTSWGRDILDSNNHILMSCKDMRRKSFWQIVLLLFCNNNWT